jgi:hypothetical protein
MRCHQAPPATCRGPPNTCALEMRRGLDAIQLPRPARGPGIISSGFITRVTGTPAGYSQRCSGPPVKIDSIRSVKLAPRDPRDPREYSKELRPRLISVMVRVHNPPTACVLRLLPPLLPNPPKLSQRGPFRASDCGDDFRPLSRGPHPQLVGTVANCREQSRNRRPPPDLAGHMEL